MNPSEASGAARSMGHDAKDVELRNWMETDAEDLRRAVVGGSDLGRQFGAADISTGRGCAEFITGTLNLPSPSARNLAITMDGRAVGNVGIARMEHLHGTGWVHYWLASEVRGRGLASRALATLAEWAFVSQDLFRLELGHRTNNPASCRVALRAGFAREGIERQKLRYGNDRFDVETHSRLKTDAAPGALPLPLAQEGHRPAGVTR